MKDKYTSLYTETDNTLSNSGLGYTVRKDLSQGLITQIKGLQVLLETHFPGAFFLPNEKELHMTLMIWLSSRIDELESKHNEFEAIYSQYHTSLRNALSGISPFSIRFHTLKLTNKTVTLLGGDQGQCKHIREAWRRNITPMGSTPPLSEIIHSTLAVCIKPLERAKVQRVLETYTIDYLESVTSFSLVKETKMRMQEFQEIEKYRLPML